MLAADIPAGCTDPHFIKSPASGKADERPSGDSLDGPFGVEGCAIGLVASGSVITNSLIDQK